MVLLSGGTSVVEVDAEIMALAILCCFLKITLNMTGLCIRTKLQAIAFCGPYKNVNYVSEFHICEVFTCFGNCTVSLA